MIYSTPRFTSTPFPEPDRPGEAAFLRKSWTEGAYVYAPISSSMSGYFITQRFRLLAAR